MPPPESAKSKRQASETSRAEKQIAASGTAVAQTYRHRSDHQAPEDSCNYQRQNRGGRNHYERAVADRDAADNSDRHKARRRPSGGPAATLDSLEALPFFSADHRSLSLPHLLERLFNVDESRNHSAPVEALDDPTMSWEIRRSSRIFNGSRLAEATTVVDKFLTACVWLPKLCHK